MNRITVPEGFAFVPRQRGVNVAAELMEAADSVKADRHTSVRTVSGGYHVIQEVADAYAAAQPAADDADAASDTETDEEKAAREAAEAEAEAARVAAEERGYPDGDPTGDWTVKQLEAWAAARDPKVDLGSGDKASKLQVALDAIKS